MAAFLNHLTSMLKEKRPERLDSLMVRGAPAISNEALERADDVLSEIVSACGTQSREETHPNGNRFVFTYRPNRITYDNEREVKVATIPAQSALCRRSRLVRFDRPSERASERATL